MSFDESSDGNEGPIKGMYYEDDDDIKEGPIKGRRHEEPVLGWK